MYTISPSYESWRGVVLMFRKAHNFCHIKHNTNWPRRVVAYNPLLVSHTRVSTRRKSCWCWSICITWRSCTAISNPRICCSIPPASSRYPPGPTSTLLSIPFPSTTRRVSGPRRQSQESTVGCFAGGWSGRWCLRLLDWLIQLISLSDRHPPLPKSKVSQTFNSYSRFIMLKNVWWQLWSFCWKMIREISRRTVNSICIFSSNIWIFIKTSDKFHF